jgi:hypothetical protein
MRTCTWSDCILETAARCGKFLIIWRGFYKLFECYHISQSNSHSSSISSINKSSVQDPSRQKICLFKAQTKKYWISLSVHSIFWQNVINIHHIWNVISFYMKIVWINHIWNGNIKAFALNWHVIWSESFEF